MLWKELFAIYHNKVLRNVCYVQYSHRCKKLPIDAKDIVRIPQTLTNGKRQSKSYHYYIKARITTVFCLQF